MRVLILLTGVFWFASLNLVSAEAPAWWSATSTQIVDGYSPGMIGDNYSPANIGQLKNVASKAAIYLDDNLPGGRGPAITSLVNSFTSGGDNYAPLNIGQLKAVAQPFYDRLAEFGFDTRQSLRSQGVPNWQYAYPWNPGTPSGENYAPANVGQLKWVFSFDLDEWPAPNQPPLVDAGANLSITTATATLTATATDPDGFPRPLTYRWKQEDGLPAVMFSPGENVLNPTVTFQQPGTYKLRLTVNDGSAVRSDVVLIHRSATATSLPLR